MRVCLSFALLSASGLLTVSSHYSLLFILKQLTSHNTTAVIITWYYYQNNCAPRLLLLLPRDILWFHLFRKTFGAFWMTFNFRIVCFHPSNLVLCFTLPPFNFHIAAASVKTDYCYGFHYSRCCYPPWRQSCFQEKRSLLSVFIWSSRAMWNRWRVQRQRSEDYTDSKLYSSMELYS